MGFFDIFKKKNKPEEQTDNSSVVEETTETASVENQQTDIAISLEQLPSTYELDETTLVEIKDSSLIAKIDSLVPSVATIGTTVGKIIKSIKTSKGETLYSVKITNGSKLVNSRTTPGAKRGFTMGAKGIKQQAELIPVDKTGKKGEVITNTGATIMGVTSLVVGQYYMHQVNLQLCLLNDHISKIVDFLNIQYKSKVASLMESVYNITKFQLSSIENDELRNRELNNLQLLREKCQELLHQAETTLETLTSKDCSTFADYEKAVNEISKWTQYQTILLKLLYQINILDFTLHLGIKSKEQCFGAFPLHTNKIESMHTRLANWHNTQCKTLKINLDESRRKHTGFLAFLEKPISWINDDWNYKEISDKMVKMIKGQTADTSIILYPTGNLFNEDVEIIAKNGKYFYLPKHNKSQQTI